MEDLNKRDEQLKLKKENSAEKQPSPQKIDADVEMTTQSLDEPTVTENLVTENISSLPTDEFKSEEVKHENWIPPEKRRPEDEFYDLKSMIVLRESDILGDGSITKLVIQEGKGAFVDMDDVVYYLHETRFDNGQLVDLQEMRKVP